MSLDPQPVTMMGKGLLPISNPEVSVPPVLPEPQMRENDTFVLKRKVEPIPKKGILDMYRDNPGGALFFQRMFCSASKAATLAGETGGKPIIGLIPVPLMTYHDIKKSQRRLGMTITAAKVGMVSEVVFNAVKTVDAVGDTVSNVGQTTYSILQLAGYGQMAILGVIFTVILPKILLVTSVIGFSSDIWSLIRVANAYREFCKRKKNEDFASLIDSLEYLKDGTSISTNITDPLLKKSMETLGSDSHKEHHFRSHDHYEVMKNHVETLFKNLDPAARKARTMLKGLDKQVFEQSSEAIINAFDENADPKKSFQDLLNCHEELKKALDGHSKERVSPEFLKELEKNREALKALMQDAKRLVNDAESDMRRLLLNNIIYVLIGMLFLAASSIAIHSDSKESEQLTQILTLSACVIHMSQFLFDSYVSKERYQEIENFFKRRSLA